MWSLCGLKLWCICFFISIQQTILDMVINSGLIMAQLTTAIVESFDVMAVVSCAIIKPEFIIISKIVCWFRGLFTSNDSTNNQRNQHTILDIIINSGLIIAQLTTAITSNDSTNKPRNQQTILDIIINSGLIIAQLTTAITSNDSTNKPRNQQTILNIIINFGLIIAQLTTAITLNNSTKNTQNQHTIFDMIINSGLIIAQLTTAITLNNSTNKPRNQQTILNMVINSGSIIAQLNTAITSQQMSTDSNRLSFVRLLRMTVKFEFVLTQKVANCASQRKDFEVDDQVLSLLFIGIERFATLLAREASHSLNNIHFINQSLNE